MFGARSIDEHKRSVVDFDFIDDWAPSLAAALKGHLPHNAGVVLVESRPEFVEDALDIVFKLGGRAQIIDATLEWLRSSTIVGYHGTRLTEEDLGSVRANGLRPLEVAARRDRLTRALSLHARWPEVHSQLDTELEAHGRGEREGQREGQVHLTMSRAGLTESFNHYINYGAEFDQRVAHTLLGDDGVELLRRDGSPTLIHVAMPGEVALDAAHPFFSVNDLRAKGDVPNVAYEFLKAWSFRQANSDFQSRTLKFDCGFMFRSVVPAEWIKEIEPLPDNLLSGR